MLRAAALAFLVTACTASAKDVEPPNDPASCVDSSDHTCAYATFFWPTGVAISPDEANLFVANANSDLLYSTGALDVVDLARIDTDVAAWLASPTDGTAASLGCSHDKDFSETMACPATPYLLTQAGVRIGDFATAVAVQDKHDAAGDLRLIVPVRGDPSVSWMDWDGAAKQLECVTGSPGGFTLCDDAHRLVRLRNDPALPTIPDEPFDVFVDSGSDYALITHLTSGSVTLVDSPRAGAPVLSDEIGGLFSADPNTGQIGAGAVAGRTPGAPDDLVYVTSKSENRVQPFSVVRPGGGPALLDPGAAFVLDTIGLNTGGRGNDARGLAFGEGGDRMYLISRDPSALEIYDTSIGPDGAVRNVPIKAVDICRSASRITVADSGDGERVYIACFDDGQIYVVDPRDTGSVDAVITVGRGPYDLVASPTRQRLYVTNYLENTISVIDLTPTAATRNRVVMRLGVPAPTTTK